MNSIFKCAAKTIIIVFISGFVGATLARFAPGYGVTEEELDSRLSGDSLRALRLSHAPPGHLLSFYLQYGGALPARRPGVFNFHARAGSTTDCGTIPRDDEICWLRLGSWVGCGLESRDHQCYSS